MKSAISLLFMSFTILLGYSVFRVVVRRDYKRKKKLSSFSTILEFLVFGVHANISYTFIPSKWPEIPVLPDNSIRTVFGLVLVGIGIIFTIGTIAKFGFKNTVGQKIDGLYQDNCYKYIRNPQIVFYGLIVVGIAMVWASFYSLGWVITYCAIVHMMVKTEEEFLGEIYGNEYKHYCYKVPRYIPSLWQRKNTT